MQINHILSQVNPKSNKSQGVMMSCSKLSCLNCISKNCTFVVQEGNNRCVDSTLGLEGDVQAVLRTICPAWLIDPEESVALTTMDGNAHPSHLPGKLLIWNHLAIHITMHGI